MIKIEPLKVDPHAIPKLANIWHEGLGKIWMPEIDITEITKLYHTELQDGTAVTYMALDNATPIGSSTLQFKDDIRPDLGPWLSDLVVTPKYQKQGIGKMLIAAVVEHATNLGFKSLYLFTFDANTTKYYQRRGWHKIGVEQFKGHFVTLMAISL